MKKLITYSAQLDEYLKEKCCVISYEKRFVLLSSGAKITGVF